METTRVSHRLALRRLFLIIIYAPAVEGYHILTPKIHIEPHIIEIPTVEADKSRSRLPHYGFSFIVL